MSVAGSCVEVNVSSTKPCYVFKQVFTISNLQKSFSNPTIHRRVGTQNQQLALPLNFAGDFERLGYHFEHLLVHGLALGGNQQQINRRAVLLAHEQHRWHAATDAADGASAVWRELSWIHDPKETFAVHDFAHEGLLAQTHELRHYDWSG